MKKRLINILCILLLIVSLTACSSNQSASVSYNSSSYDEDVYTDWYDEVDYTDPTSYNSLDEVVENADYFSTPNSTAFSIVGYNYAWELLIVEFRTTGSCYLYYDVPEDVWEEFLYADSLGGYYNEYIKGDYDCEQYY